MNTKDAIKILRDKGYQVDVVSRNKYIVTDMGYSANYSGRELVNFARIWTSEGQNTPTKKLVKEFDKKKNRQATRQAIHHKNYDKIPQNEKVKQEDVWNWD